MSYWDERIRSHRAWELLVSSGSLIDKALESTLSAGSVVSLERIKMILAACEKRLASADPLLIFPTVIENIAVILEVLGGNLRTPE